MLRIRLRPTKQKGFFHIVVVDSRKPLKTGNCVQNLGHYCTHRKTGYIHKDGYNHYISVGAQPSETVHSTYKSGRLQDKSTASDQTSVANS